MWPFPEHFLCNMPMLFLCDMRMQSGEASCLERGELALTFHDFKEVGGKENWENPASLVGWTEIYTKGSQVFCHIAGKRRGQSWTWVPLWLPLMVPCSVLSLKFF